MAAMDPLLLCEQLRRHAAHRPHQTALIDEAGQVTFAELWRGIEGAASTFAALGIKPGERVGFALQPSLAHVVALHGCMASGAIPVLLNIRLTPPELRAFLEPIEPVRIVCDPMHEPLVRELGVAVTVLPDAAAAGSLPDRLAPLYSDASFSTELDENAVALIVPTGGTTGVPKGAMLSHRSLWLWVQARGAGTIRRRDDLELYYAPFFHVSLVTYCFSALHYGTTTRILPRFSPERILQLIAEGATHLNGAPTTFSALRRLPEFAATDRSRVRDAGFGAMAATEDFIQQIVRDYPNARLRHAYGSTEVGTVTQFTHEDFMEGRTIGVGHVAPSVRITVVDDDLTPLPPGEVGELVVDCPWAMSGYWGRPEETRAACTPLGIRTGDLGAVDEDGWVVIRGRKKEMIISGGENVFPNEVESMLAGHPAVAEISVYGASDAHWGERVEAAVVLRLGAELDLRQLADFGRQALAGYKLPKVLWIMDAIPMTPANKPDRRRLREMAERADKE
jgi:fatty-acyl-CoA synthase